MTAAAKVRLENKDIRIDIDAKQGAFDVYQKKSRTRWIMERNDKLDLVVIERGVEIGLALNEARRIQVRPAGSSRCRIEYSGFKKLNADMEVAVLLRLKGEDLEVELDVDDADPALTFDSLYYPRAFVLPAKKENYYIFPSHQGKLVPATFRKNIDARLGWKPKLKMHGAVQNKAGFLCLWDTPYDVLLAEMNSARSGPRYFPRNMSSLGRFRYTRRFILSFRTNTDYAGLTRNVYRPFAMGKGYVRPLADRIKDKPRIRDLPGSLVFHQFIAAIRHRTLVKKVVTFDHARKVFQQVQKATGLTKGLYHLDGWCRQGYDALHPDVLPPNAEAGGLAGMSRLSKTVANKGWHFGLHDNYLLYYLEAEQYHDDDAVWDENLRVFRNRSCTPGGANAVQTPSAAKRFAMKNYVTGSNVYRRRWKPLLETCKIGFCYFDQFLHSGGGFDQDFNPAHTLNRQEFIRGMLDVIDVMGDNGVLTSSEHMYDFGMGHYDVNGNSAGVAMDAPAESGIPVPLWSLALHECMVTNDCDHGPANIVRAGLIGGILHHRQNFSHEDPAVVAREIRYINDTAPLRKLHKEICFRECTGSKLLKADGSVQVTDFDGIKVKGDMEKMTLEISGSKKANGKFDFSHLSDENMGGIKY